MENDKDEIENYGDDGIQSYEGKVPRWLKVTYFILPLWGIIWFYYFWNGSYGWLDRGYWSELQQAAHTTFPIVNQDTIPYEDK